MILQLDAGGRDIKPTQTCLDKWFPGTCYNVYLNALSVQGEGVAHHAHLDIRFWLAHDASRGVYICIYKYVCTMYLMHVCKQTGDVGNVQGSGFQQRAGTGVHYFGM